MPLVPGETGSGRSATESAFAALAIAVGRWTTPTPESCISPDKRGCQPSGHVIVREIELASMAKPDDEADGEQGARLESPPRPTWRHSW
jgi:hypothetical protein